MAISSWDEFPVHQSPDWIRNVGPSDRNFYDRNYFCMHGSSDELFAIFGMGPIPESGGSGRVLLRAPRRRAPCDSRLPSAHRPDGHVGRPHAHRGDRAVEEGALHRGTQRAHHRHGRHLGCVDPGHGGAQPVHPPRGPGGVQHPALRPARSVERYPVGGRRGLRGYARPVGRGPRPLVGHSTGGRARGRRHPPGGQRHGRHVELLPDDVRRPRPCST